MRNLFSFATAIIILTAAFTIFVWTASALTDVFGAVVSFAFRIALRK